MPDSARLLIKTSLLWLGISFALSAATAIKPAPVGLWPGAAVYPSALHLITVGWLTQLIFGVAFWLFPRWSKEQPHGPAWVMWIVYACLNAGLILRLLFEPYPMSAGRDPVLALSAVLQAAAGVLFAAYTWNRVKVK